MSTTSACTGFLTAAPRAIHHVRILREHSAHLEPALRTSLRVFLSPAQRFEEMASCDMAVAVSGTVTMELAAAHTPALVIYRANWVTALVAKRLANVDYVALPNILAGDRVMPGEFAVQGMSRDYGGGGGGGTGRE